VKLTTHLPILEITNWSAPLHSFTELIWEILILLLNVKFVSSTPWRHMQGVDAQHH
jgi:hypothetical protein